MSRSASSLLPDDGYAVPLFGEAVPIQQAMFARSTDQPVAPGAQPSCPACGGSPCAGCGATALLLPDDDRPAA